MHLFSCLRSLALCATVFYAISYGILILKAYCEIWTKKTPSGNAELIFWSLWQEKAPLYVSLNLGCAYFVMSYKIFIFVVLLSSCNKAMTSCDACSVLKLAERDKFIFHVLSVHVPPTWAGCFHGDICQSLILYCQSLHIFWKMCSSSS